ncbi:MAG TPA: MarR family transcriptional regulator [Streptosporangiaceae bacterium]|nr:MarR family transcriptional regulator [Streptosporangiaceae bacterium]
MISDFEKSTGSAPGSPGTLILELQRATHAMLRLLAARLAQENLTGAEINALANLADGAACSVGDLAAATGTRPTTLTSVLDRLARRGYLTRELDPADRRSFLLNLTDDGILAARAARTAMATIEQQALGQLPAADVAGFRNVVRALEKVAR